MRTVEEIKDSLYQHAEKLHAAGFRKASIARLIVAYGEYLPIFGQQLQGVYIDPQGLRNPHTCVPGWYQIIKAEGKRVWLLKTYCPTADPFETGTEWLESTIMANDEMITKGHPSPDKSFDPNAAL